jgi:glutamate/tyrosine decarboxylase-like PLP-dependent enzyme
MAVKTARDWAAKNRPVEGELEILVPETAHPAFEKAAHMTGMRIVRMASSHGWRADPEAMAEALGPKTVMLVASAPPYPYGVVDPVADIAALASAEGLWMHVDACIGGFVLPFAVELGEDVPAFDLSVPGVRSISADLHKFGYSGRGASLLLLADGADQAYQRFSSDAWPAGTYETLNYGGSRNGGAIASSWAVMRYLGRAGYRERVAQLLATKRRLMAGIEAIGPFHVLGTPQGAHFSFASDALDMVAVAEGMEARDWILARLQRPHGITMLITPRHTDIAEEVLHDLAEVAEEVGSGRREAAGTKAVYVG